ncbi:hypothetical protein [Halorubrum sp. CBA1229]|uniref:hypothetical protein n=1 Tax=Halorubrum sp. CBA1229 TaxID=1853699 RepID=UPI000F3DB64D|nr:hypothetical protein [Halorubrum sp. CBA1229]QKY16400.1 hypothetical protein Hrr1229_005730 [Halorubrum sp. CBA1229]
MTSISSGGGGGYDYVETFYPSDAEEGESLYHLDEDAAYVYTGTEWTEQTVTDHSQLSGVGEDTHFTHAAVAGSGSHTDLSDVTEGDHRSDGRVSDLAPLQSVNGRTGDVTGLFEATDYNPESDTHSRYTDSEAAAAAFGPKKNYSDQVPGGDYIDGSQTFKTFNVLSDGSQISATYDARGRSDGGYPDNHPGAGIRLESYNSVSQDGVIFTADDTFEIKSGSVSMNTEAGEVVEVIIRSTNGNGDGGPDDTIDYVDYDLSA